MSKLTELPVQALSKVQDSVGKVAGKYWDRGSAELHYARKMFESGALKLEPPQDIAAFVADIRRWGEFGMIPALNARRTPDAAAVIDDFGEMTFADLDAAANAVANGLLAKGIKGGDGVAILARNHRWFLVSVYGAAKTGARIILLNSEFSGPQIKEVSEREGGKLVIYDDEYTAAVMAAEPELGKLRALDIKSPATVGRYVKEMGETVDAQGVGHSPLGGYAVLVLLTSVLVQAILGLFSWVEWVYDAPFSPLVDEDTRNQLSNWHVQSFNFLVGFAVVHVCAVVYYWMARDDDLLTPMFTGQKLVEDPGLDYATPLRALIAVAGGLTLGWGGVGLLEALLV